MPRIHVSTNDTDFIEKVTKIANADAQVMLDNAMGEYIADAADRDILGYHYYCPILEYRAITALRRRPWLFGEPRLPRGSVPAHYTEYMDVSAVAELVNYAKTDIEEFIDDAKVYLKALTNHSSVSLPVLVYDDIMSEKFL